MALMTMLSVAVDSTANLAFIGSLRYSRTKSVRCVPRSLASRQLLGPESQALNPLLEER